MKKNKKVLKNEYVERPKFLGVTTINAETFLERFGFVNNGTSYFKNPKNENQMITSFKFKLDWLSNFSSDFYRGLWRIIYFPKTKTYMLENTQGEKEVIADIISPLPNIDILIKEIKD